MRCGRTRAPPHQRRLSERLSGDQACISETAKHGADQVVPLTLNPISEPGIIEPAVDRPPAQPGLCGGLGGRGASSEGKDQRSVAGGGFCASE